MTIFPDRMAQLEYRRRLQRLINWMGAKVSKEMLKLYETNIVGDSPYDDFKSLVYKFTRMFYKKSDEYAETLIKESQGHVDRLITNSINRERRKKDKNAKYLKFRTTPKELRRLDSLFYKENIALIRSIPEEYFERIETTLVESLEKGADISGFKKALLKDYGITKRRAETIARDQTRKATAMIGIERMKAIGITEATWIHSGGGKQPRPSHVAANGKKFDINKGMLIEGEWIYPGYPKINCRCVSRFDMTSFEE